MILALSAGIKESRFKNDYRVYFSQGNPQLLAFEAIQTANMILGSAFELAVISLIRFGLDQFDPQFGTRRDRLWYLGAYRWQGWFTP